MVKNTGGNKDFFGYADKELFKLDSGILDNAIVTIVESGYIKALFSKESGVSQSRIFGPGESINSILALQLYRLSKEVVLSTVDKPKPENAILLLKMQAQFLIKSQRFIEVSSHSHTNSRRTFAKTIINLFADYGIIENNIVSLPFVLTDEVLSELITIEREPTTKIQKEMQGKMGFWKDDKRIYRIPRDNLVKLLTCQKFNPSLVSDNKLE